MMACRADKPKPGKPGRASRTIHRGSLIAEMVIVQYSTVLSAGLPCGFPVRGPRTDNPLAGWVKPGCIHPNTLKPLDMLCRVCYNLYMADINIRKMPDDLIRKVKAQAALKGITMRDYVIASLQATIQGEEGAPKKKRGTASRTD